MDARQVWRAARVRLDIRDNLMPVAVHKIEHFIRRHALGPIVVLDYLSTDPDSNGVAVDLGLKADRLKAVLKVWIRIHGETPGARPC